MADAESSESSDDKGENKDMPPPCLPVKLPQKTRLTNGETAQYSQSNENKEPTSSQDKEQTPSEIPYKVPSWSGIPDDFYSLEVLKNGCIISTIDITSKPYHVFGRLPNCDVSLEHPSVSRYHAVIQYKASESSKSDKGFYIYDLGSTHGTVVNKARLEARRYYRLRVGYVFKFGGSSRLFILQGPEECEESDSMPPMEEAVSSSRDVGCVMSEEEYEDWKREREGGRFKDEHTGIDWGMGEDAVEESTYPPDFGQGDEDAEEHQFKDPKKTLRGFYEREGLELEYDVEEKGPGHARVYHCKVKLPIDGPGGEPLYAEAAVAGKKKESVLECAKEACRMLDAAGLLRQSTHESKKHKEKNWEENDYYDSDEDTFLDRTGSVEKKRLIRMKRAGKDDSTLETYESLMSKLEAVNDEIKCHESKLQQNSKDQKDTDANVADSLDDYMRSLGVTLDKSTISQIRRKLFELKKERQRLTKLVNIAKPASLPTLSGPYPSESERVNDEVSGKPRSKGKPSDSTVATTVDRETDKRHEKAIPPGEGGTKKDFVDNSDISKEGADLNAQQRPAEFVVPTKVQHFKRKRSRPREVNQESNKSDQSKIVQPPIGDNQRSPIDVSDREADQSQCSQNKKADDVAKDAEIPSKKKKRSYGATSQWEAVNDPTYSAWMPPADQTGDGRTHLNEKFGY